MNGIKYKRVLERRSRLGKLFGFLVGRTKKQIRIAHNCDKLRAYVQGWANIGWWWWWKKYHIFSWCSCVFVAVFTRQLRYYKRRLGLSLKRYLEATDSESVELSRCLHFNTLLLCTVTKVMVKISVWRMLCRVLLLNHKTRKHNYESRQPLGYKF